MSSHEKKHVFGSGDGGTKDDEGQRRTAVGFAGAWGPAQTRAFSLFTLPWAV